MTSPTPTCCRSTRLAQASSGQRPSNLRSSSSTSSAEEVTIFPKSCRSPTTKASSVRSPRSRASSWQTAALTSPSIQMVRRMETSGPMDRACVERPLASSSRSTSAAPMRVMAPSRSATGGPRRYMAELAQRRMAAASAASAPTSWAISDRPASLRPSASWTRTATAG
ncbi:MAG: hypothetical protein QM767_04605 [Anaeromyxobacter sp.]